MNNYSIKEFVAKIRLRSVMYITRSDIFCLKAYLDGWVFGAGDKIDDLWIMRDFQIWIEKKYQTRTDHSWTSLIAFNSRDNSEALQNFFSLFDEFLAGK